MKRDCRSMIGIYEKRRCRKLVKKMGCRAQNSNLESFSLTTLSSISLLLVRQHAGEVNVSLFAVGLCCRHAAKAVADRRHLCLRQQLLVLQRRQPRPRLTDSDRRFWILAYRWFVSWQTSLLIVKPETVLRWHRQGWRSYWRRRSSRRGKTGRPPIAAELRNLIGRMNMEVQSWSQVRILAEVELRRV